MVRKKLNLAGLLVEVATSYFTDILSFVAVLLPYKKHNVK